jgi:DNA-binding NarL/FixJ family response regulator
MANLSIRVLNVQPKWLISEAIAAALRAESFNIVYSGCDTEHALASAGATGIDVAVVHQKIALDPDRDLRFTDQIRTLNSKVRIIVILEELDRDSVVRAFRAGAAGVLTEDTSLAQLADCVTWVYKGNVWASSVELGYLVSALSHNPATSTSAAAAALLSARERQVVDALVLGFTNREIAAHLELSECTVRNHLYRIFDKLGVYSRVELALWMAAHTDAAEQTAVSPNNENVASMRAKPPERVPGPVQSQTLYAERNATARCVRKA